MDSIPDFLGILEEAAAEETDPVDVDPTVLAAERAAAMSAFVAMLTNRDQFDPRDRYIVHSGELMKEGACSDAVNSA